MPAKTGNTHAKHIGVFLDNLAGALTEITAYVNSVGTVGLKHDESEVTSFSDGTKNIVIGHPEAPIQIGGAFDTTLHAHMIAINGRNVGLSLDIQIGIRQAWVAGEPQFGITSSTPPESGYVVSGYTPDFDAMTWTAQLNVIGPTAPEFNVAAEA